MGRTLNELAGDLKKSIIEQQSDAHNRSGIRAERYNNLKLKMDAGANPTPHVIVCIGMSEAVFDVKTGELKQGSLGPDERYVLRWFGKSSTIPDLRECWGQAVQETSKSGDKKSTGL